MPWRWAWSKKWYGWQDWWWEDDIVPRWSEQSSSSSRWFEIEPNVNHSALQFGPSERQLANEQAGKAKGFGTEPLLTTERRPVMGKKEDGLLMTLLTFSRTHRPHCGLKWIHK